MHLAVDPHSLIGKPLFLRRTIIAGETAADDYVVVCNDLTVARITLTPKSFGRASWDWSVTGPHIPREMGKSSGSAESLQEAKDMVRAVFDRWLAFYGANPDRAVWMG